MKIRYSELQKHHTFTSSFTTIPWDSLLHSIDRFKKYGMELEPDFQRGHVWTEEQQSAYVEYIISGGDSGKVIYINRGDWNNTRNKFNNYVLLDGLQRLTAVSRFLKNEILACGTLFEEFEDIMPHHLQFQLKELNLEKRSDIIKSYLLFNSGGTPHSKEEISRVRDLLQEELRYE